MPCESVKLLTVILCNPGFDSAAFSTLASVHRASSTVRVMGRQENLFSSFFYVHPPEELGAFEGIYTQ